MIYYHDELMTIKVMMSRKVVINYDDDEDDDDDDIMGSSKNVSETRPHRQQQAECPYNDSGKAPLRPKPCSPQRLHFTNN